MNDEMVNFAIETSKKAFSECTEDMINIEEEISLEFQRKYPVLQK